MVSTACLMGRQTILVSFFPQDLLNGSAGKGKGQMDRKLKTQLDAS